MYQLLGASGDQRAFLNAPGRAARLSTWHKALGPSGQEGQKTA